VPYWRHISIFIAIIAVSTLLLRLGFWQLNRGFEKQSIIKRIEENKTSTILSEEKLQYPIEKKDEYQKIKLKGVLINEKQFLLDNQILNHQIGYRVLSPFKLQNKDKLILVNRGWIPAENSREKLPTLTPIQEEIEITGMIKLPPNKIFRLKKTDEDKNRWPRRIQQLDLNEISKDLNKAIFPIIILLDENNHFGFIREWEIHQGLPPEKHFAYAGQWFTLTLTFLILCTILTIKNRKKTREK